ncbi:MAG: haloacid dehalogenase type II [Paracoccaceae bacterium]
MDQVKALLFDTFGTVVDWRGSVARQVARLAEMKGIEGLDTEAFARAWRAGYHPGMAPVIAGERPWTPIDVIHRERLDVILEDFGIAAHFDEAERADLNLAWHRLDPWPDSVPGLRRLARNYIVGPLSNGSTPLLINMAKRAGIPWDVIMSSDATRGYKPDPKTYLGACEMLGMTPPEVMMCAAHNNDLEAAASHGMRTAYINRPTEYGEDQSRDTHATGDWDIVTDHIEGIADVLGC